MTEFVSLEPEGRRELLKEIGAQHGLNVFIETGTNMGLTPLALKDSFKQVYTIELDDALWARADRMFRHDANVECIHGNSAEELPKILDKLKEPALIWLDGHYSGPGTAFTPESTPIREELMAVFLDGRRHVVLVDDARIFGGGPEHDLYPHYEPYPELSWVDQVANERGYLYALKDDIIRLYPQELVTTEWWVGGSP